MRSQLCISFVLLNVILQATVACTQQPPITINPIPTNTTTTTDTTTTSIAIKKDLPQPPSTINNDTLVQVPDKQISLKAGIYTAGSRYITIANQESRTCYQGESMPSGRYPVAVGETTGSLYAEKDYFVANGWKKYGKTVTLRQNEKNLSIALDGNPPTEYNYFRKVNVEQYSESLMKCLNSTDDFFEAAPGYKISVPNESQTTEVTGNLLSSEQTAKLLQLPIPVVAPTFLPEGFRLVQAKGEVNKYANAGIVCSLIVD